MTSPSTQGDAMHRRRLSQEHSTPCKAMKSFCKLGKYSPCPQWLLLVNNRLVSQRLKWKPLQNYPEFRAVARFPGSLGLHEEYANEVAAIVLPFLRS